MRLAVVVLDTQTLEPVDSATAVDRAGSRTGSAVRS